MGDKYADFAEDSESGEELRIVEKKLWDNEAEIEQLKMVIER